MRHKNENEIKDKCSARDWDLKKPTSRQNVVDTVEQKFRVDLRPCPYYVWAGQRKLSHLILALQFVRLVIIAKIWLQACNNPHQHHHHHRHHHHHHHHLDHDDMKDGESKAGNIFALHSNWISSLPAPNVECLLITSDWFKQSKVRSGRY